MDDNIFLVLGVQSREDCVSNAIAYAFNNSEYFRRGFLRYICEKDPSVYTNCHAHTRVSTGASGIPDVVLVCECQEGADLIVIENKLKAEEGEDQTKKYASPESIQNLGRRLAPARKIQPYFVFLTLFPDQTPAAGDIYLVKRHYELVTLAEHSESRASLADKLISDWCMLVSKFWEKNDVGLDDIVSAKLEDAKGLEGGYLYFRSALSKIDLPQDLKIEFYRDSRQGRRYYGAIISKAAWHPSEMIKEGDTWKLDSRQNIHVHFEPHYDALNKIFALRIDYEVNPYRPKKWFESNISRPEQIKYLDRRRSFIDKLKSRNVSGWIFSESWNQIAKAKLNINGLTFDAFQNSIRRLLIKMTGEIDTALLELN